MSDELDEAVFAERSIEPYRRVCVVQVHCFDGAHGPSLPDLQNKVAGNAGDW